MIRITQGHESGIGPEVLFKSLALIPSKQQDNILLYLSDKDTEKNLIDLDIPFKKDSKSLSIFGSCFNCKFITSNEKSSTQATLDRALEDVRTQDILVTLPTSKDQLTHKNVPKKGYTEYLRSYYQKKDLCMTFVGPDEKLLLITDHIPLSEVAIQINNEIILSKIKTTLDHYVSTQSPIEEVLISGINPHAGEGGLLGNEDETVEKVIAELSIDYPDVHFSGPLPGDTLDFHKTKEKHQLFVYMYHDQGLSKFKALNSTIGINQTLGLDFIRLSVDHGTAFNLYGKNTANYIGCYYLLDSALKLNEAIASSRVNR